MPLNSVRASSNSPALLMAKSVEDTLFFLKSRHPAINEVGAEPLYAPLSVEHFHQQMQTRLHKQPDALSPTTSTHDTKRGEDARARLYTLSEAPARWAENVSALAGAESIRKCSP